MSEIPETNQDKCQPTHVAYADETNYNTGRFRGVALVTLGVAEALQSAAEIRQITDKFGIREFKWAKLKSAQNRFAALEIVEYIVNLLMSSNTRIDVLVWDIEDTRHRIQNRSDIRNLRRMYYFLYRNVLGRRWSDSCRWELKPAQSSFRAASHLSYLGNPDELNDDARLAQVCRIIEIDSKDEPLAQVADLFAGAAVYSRNSFSTYKAWNLARIQAHENAEAITLSNADRERCPVIEYIYQQCKTHKLYVSLSSTEGLRTRDPRSPMNFWWYEPQGEYDKAPLWH